MATNEGKYNIKAISNMLGIQPGTLRAWERRYHIVEPIRNQAGHRLYSDEHVAILRWLLEKVNKGFTIGQAVGLLEKGNFSFDSGETVKNEDYSVQLTNEILHSLLQFREHAAHELMNQAFSMFHIDKVMVDILGSLLVKVGDMWENNEITIAHEHFVTSFLRTKIGNIFHGFPVDGYLPKVVAVCGPQEKHELGLLMFTLFLRRKGFEVIYLGAGIPKEDVEFVIGEVKAKFFFTSCTMTINLPETLSLLDVISKQFPDIAIGLGGAAVNRLSLKNQEKYGKHIVGQSKDDWEKWLSQYLYR
ncbi:MerR family transcriptional regulator [Alkalihalobacterium bogoriense]|uniref:MerR family transcriptional regulator n=1 Tax=Alkalihalobacterium bogoriense TaxID=246272 RepID=UPI00047E52F8|nr:MerR family transcriptional regulator [Alkalihalobacterium bogoriense]